MPEIGLFPLALVLAPTERVPLHIFEPRYKELIGECIAGAEPFGLLLEDDSGRRDIGTLADVREVVHVFDDGRMNILVEGRDRFRVTEWTDGRSFPTAEVEPLEDEDDALPEATAAEEALVLFRHSPTWPMPRSKSPTVRRGRSPSRSPLTSTSARNPSRS